VHIKLYYIKKQAAEVFYLQQENNVILREH